MNLHAGCRLPGNRLGALDEIVRVSTASASAINGGFASNGEEAHAVQATSRSSTITRRASWDVAQFVRANRSLNRSKRSNERRCARSQTQGADHRITEILNGQRAITGALRSA